MTAHPPTQLQTLNSPLGWAVQAVSRLHSAQNEREMGTSVCHSIIPLCQNSNKSNWISFNFLNSRCTFSASLTHTCTVGGNQCEKYLISGMNQVQLSDISVGHHFQRATWASFTETEQRPRVHRYYWNLHLFEIQLVRASLLKAAPLALCEMYIFKNSGVVL